MNKKILIFVLTISMVFTFIACRNENSNNQSTANTVNNLQNTSSESATENQPVSQSNTQNTEGSEVVQQTDIIESLAVNNNTDIQNENIPEDFVLVEGGTFEMGSPDTESWRGADETAHTVTVSNFYISKYELTQTDYEQLMGENPSTFSGENFPVENITWFEAISYCNARSEADGLTPVYTIEEQNVSWNRMANGYRLPTEAEWEYACRANTTTPFNTQTSISAEEANYYGHYPYGIEGNYFSQGNLDTKPGRYRETTIAVGSFEPNAWGIYDMHGNVGEWVWDYYGEYDSTQTDNPSGPTSGTMRVYRGGGWNDFAKNLRSAYRAAMRADGTSFNLGMRLVLNNVAGIDSIVDSAVEQKNPENNGKVLIAYFSWSGNTEGIAKQISEQIDADLFEIECKKPYSDNYNTVLEQAQQDQYDQARPELAEHVEDITQYDTIILGYPNWWASIPMPIASFLEEYDFSGKTIIPFCSHGGGRFGQSLTTIAKLAPDAIMGEGLSVHYSGGSTLSSDITEWLRTNGVMK